MEVIIFHVWNRFVCIDLKLRIYNPKNYLLQNSYHKRPYIIVNCSTQQCIHVCHLFNFSSCFIRTVSTWQRKYCIIVLLLYNQRITGMLINMYRLVSQEIYVTRVLTLVYRKTSLKVIPPEHEQSCPIVKKV